jgi:hypothetical protein
VDPASMELSNIMLNAAEQCLRQSEIVATKSLIQKYKI